MRGRHREVPQPRVIAGAPRSEGSTTSGRASWSIAPVVDSPVVGAEAVLDPPQHRLGATADANLAVGRTDVGLDGVRAEVGQASDLTVRFALRDEREDLRLAVAQTLRLARPLEPDVDTRLARVGA